MLNANKVNTAAEAVFFVVCLTMFAFPHNQTILSFVLSLPSLPFPFLFLLFLPSSSVFFRVFLSFLPLSSLPLSSSVFLNTTMCCKRYHQILNFVCEICTCVRACVLSLLNDVQSSYCMYISAPSLDHSHPKQCACTQC